MKRFTSSKGSAGARGFWKKAKSVFLALAAERQREATHGRRTS